MLTAPFNVIGSEGMYVSELKVIGYQDEAKWQENLGAPEVLMKRYNLNGALTATYVWTDTWGGTAWAGGYWQHVETGKKLVKNVVDEGTEEADVLMPAGECVWTVTPTTKGTTSHTIDIRLVYNGEVLQQSQTFPLGATRTRPGNKGVGNLLQRAIGVTELSVVGYQESSKWQENLGAPEVLLKKFNTNGALTATYAWTDTWGGTAWAGGYWQHVETGKKLVKTVVDEGTEEADVSVEPGDGFWCVCPTTKDNAVSLSLIFPKLNP